MRVKSKGAEMRAAVKVCVPAILIFVSSLFNLWLLSVVMDALQLLFRLAHNVAQAVNTALKFV